MFRLISVKQKCHSKKSRSGGAPHTKPLSGKEITNWRISRRNLGEEGGGDPLRTCRENGRGECEGHPAAIASQFPGNLKKYRVKKSAQTQTRWWGRLEGPSRGQFHGQKETESFIPSRSTLLTRPQGLVGQAVGVFSRV